jgi:hypothetical protein
MKNGCLKGICGALVATMFSVIAAEPQKRIYIVG